MTKENYDALCRDISSRGIIFQPLADNEYKALRLLDFSHEECISVALDLAAMYSMRRAIEAVIANREVAQ